MSKAKSEPAQIADFELLKQERMYVCLKCGDEYWLIPTPKRRSCECGGQLIANPRRG